ncbi:TIGR03564 family F420-dependent LLM class oxidoreductase [Frankia sp. QA3]|uniref:TIGR03564 family F420-dependent LLM class oxidoreductase n=1 Tax=Frankia sp. QA3 TaxID=710111 RepID=UPI000269BE7B|nr:TIGR03564 family F420-dependent LLM class oxidoreductase [Frankia sp. QA3]EIV93063.1 F420-dependent oxidoreductase, MSMEG_4879 family [Frankia sp. QA3]
MRIGITVGEVRGPADLPEIVGQVRAAAEAGLDTAWFTQALGWDALTTLGLAGSRVPEIALGTAVLPVPARHPLVLAGQALSVQAALGDRFTLGIGAGIGFMVDAMFGLATDRPARRMREYLTVLRPLLRSEEVTHRGEFWTAVGAVSVPGAQAPPVLLAALGPAMLRVAGELADGTVTWMTGPRTLAEHVVPGITAAAAAAGRPRPRIVAGVLVAVTRDPAAARAAVADRFGLAGRVPEYRAVLDREGAAGPADVAVVGDTAEVARQLVRYAEAGVTDLFVSPIGDAVQQRRTVAALAEVSAVLRVAPSSVGSPGR